MCNADYLGTTCTVTPFFGTTIMTSLSRSFSSVRSLFSKVYLWSILASTSLATINANLNPTQLRGPAPNGNQAMGCLSAIFSLVNLWEINEINLFEKNALPISLTYILQNVILTSYCTVLDFIHEYLFWFYFDEALAESK